MNSGIMYKPGDIVLAKVPFTENSAMIKKRPALILFNNKENYVVLGITSNLKRKDWGILLTQNDGLLKPSILRIDYIFTLDSQYIEKKIAELTSKKKWELLLKIFYYLYPFFHGN